MPKKLIQKTAAATNDLIGSKIGNKTAKSSKNTITQIKFKTAMLRLGLCDYSGAYILVKRTVTPIGQGAEEPAIQADRNNKQVIFKISVSLTDCITEINNTSR